MSYFFDIPPKWSFVLFAYLGIDSVPFFFFTMRKHKLCESCWRIGSLQWSLKRSETLLLFLFMSCGWMGTDSPSLGSLEFWICRVLQRCMLKKKQRWGADKSFGVMIGSIASLASGKLSTENRWWQLRNWSQEWCPYLIDSVCYFIYVPPWALPGSCSFS